MFKTIKPYFNAQPSHIFQAFGVKQPKLSADFSGIDYHPGIDMAFPNCYGTFLVAPEDCSIANLVHPNRLVDVHEGNQLLLRGYGVLMQSLRDPEIFYVYWHTLPVFPVEIGQKVKRGEIVAEIGNSGFILSSFMGGLVPVELRNRPPYYGSHLHYEMYRWTTRKEYLNPVDFIDWTAPVKLDILPAIKQILYKIGNLIKDR